MKSIFSILLLFLIAKSYAQDTIYLHGVNDTIATTKEKALYYKTINSGVNPVEVNTYYTNGNKYSKAHYSSLIPEIKDGEYESYFYNGNINLKGTYKNNKLEGIWLAYNKEKNFIELKEMYKESLRNGRSFTFYENGKLSRLDIFVRDTLALSTCYDSIGNVIECDLIIDKTEISDNTEVMPSFIGGVPALWSY